MLTPLCIETATNNADEKTKSGKDRAELAEIWAAMEEGSKTKTLDWVGLCEKRGVIISAIDVEAYGHVRAMYTETAAPTSFCALCDAHLRGFAQVIAHMTTDKHIARVCTCSLTGQPQPCRCEKSSASVVYDCFAIPTPADNVTGGQITDLPVQPAFCLGA